MHEVLAVAPLCSDSILKGRPWPHDEASVGSFTHCFMQIAAVLTTALLVGWVTRRYVPVAAKPVYLIDTYTYKPPDRCFKSSIDCACSRGTRCSH